MALAAAGWLALALPPAQAAVPDYQSFEIPAPQPQASSAFGERLRALGDVNDDGVRDVLMSSSSYDGDDGNGGVLVNSGRLYIFSGKTRALLRTLEPPFPQAGAQFGFWDANLGDVDGDGTADFVTSASGQTVGGVKTGQVYVYSGRTGTRLRTINPPEPLAATGTFGGDFGGNLVGPGDLTGDGVGDLVATASGAFAGVGAAYAFNGRTGAFLYKVSNPSPQASAFGFGAAEVGDLNGDGAAEYEVGAPRFDAGAIVDAGISYVINGRTGAVMYTLSNPEPEANDRFGQADADGVSLGDITGDGKPDIYVDSFLGNQAQLPGPPLDNAGKAFLFNGASGALIGALRDPMPEGGRGFGASNASAGDIDKDGRPDSIVSSRGASGTTNIGRATVFGGPALGTVLKTFVDPRSQGAALFGTGLAYPGDVNGDGLPDYFISARGTDVAGIVDTGTAYAFISQAPAPTPTPTVTPGPYYILPTPTPTPTMTASPSPTPTPRKRPGLSARVRPKRDRRKPYRFTTRGTLRRPSGVSQAAGCKGKVRITVKRKGRKKTLSSRLARVKGSCRFSSKVSFKNRKRFGKGRRGTLRFRIRFQGNARLLPLRITRTARYG